MWAPVVVGPLFSLFHWNFTWPILQVLRVHARLTVFWLLNILFRLFIRQLPIMAKFSHFVKWGHCKNWEIFQNFPDFVKFLGRLSSFRVAFSPFFQFLRKLLLTALNFTFILLHILKSAFYKVNKNNYFFSSF